MARDDRDKPPRVFGSRVLFAKRFHISANGRQRRAKLVGDVGHEVAPNLVGAPEVGDVVHHEDHAVRAVADRRRRPRDDRTRGVARRR